MLTIKLNLGERCQRALIAATGVPVAREYVLSSVNPADIVKALELDLGRVDKDGDVWVVGSGVVDELPSSAARALELLRAQQELVDRERERQAKELEARQAKELEELVARALVTLDDWLAMPWPTLAEPGEGAPLLRPVETEALAETAGGEVALKRRDDRTAARARCLRAREEALDKAIALAIEGVEELDELPPWATQAQRRRYGEWRVARRLVRIRYLVLEGSADQNAKERLVAGPGALGYLGEEEAIEVIRAARLPVSPELPPYRKIATTDVRAHCECLDTYDDRYRGDVRYRSRPAGETGLTGSEWETVVSLRKRLFEAKLPPGEIRIHWGECDDARCPHKPVRRVGIRVALDLGDGVVVEREYGESHE